MREEERKEMKTQGGKKQEEKDDMITVTLRLLSFILFLSFSHSLPFFLFLILSLSRSQETDYVLFPSSHKFQCIVKHYPLFPAFLFLTRQNPLFLTQ